MKYIPAILIISSFIIICIGAYLKSQHNMLGMPLIVGGLLGELIFIAFNRLLKRNKEE